MVIGQAVAATFAGFTCVTESRLVASSDNSELVIDSAVIATVSMDAGAVAAVIVEPGAVSFAVLIPQRRADTLSVTVIMNRWPGI
jgi:hypothetical protein